MDSSRKALIIGAGISGLTAAIALRRAGLDATVYEQASGPRATGAGLWLWPNAIRALDRLGIADAIRAVGAPHTRSTIRSRHGETLTDIAAYANESPSRVESVAIHRADLQAALLDALDRDSVHTGARCSGFTQDAGGVTVYFDNGGEAHGDILIGADGVHSTIRARLFSAAPARYAGFTAWRAVVQLGGTSITPGMTWGHGARFGFIPLRNDRVNWFAALNVPESKGETAGSKHELLKHFHDWHAPIAEVIESTDEALIRRDAIYACAPLKRWSQGCVTLLGDAAHAMTPSLGQGACQAIEDAVTLAQSLGTGSDISAALQRYETRRSPRANAVARQSRFIDWLIQMDHPLLCRLRDLLTRRMPASIRERRLAWLIEYPS